MKSAPSVATDDMSQARNKAAQRVLSFTGALFAVSMNTRLQPTIALMTRAVIRIIPARATIPINAIIGFRSSFMDSNTYLISRHFLAPQLFGFQNFEACPARL